MEDLPSFLMQDVDHFLLSNFPWKMFDLEAVCSDVGDWEACRTGASMTDSREKASASSNHAMGTVCTGRSFDFMFFIAVSVCVCYVHSMLLNQTDLHTKLRLETYTFDFQQLPPDSASGC